MNVVKEKAFAKINLFLDVKGRREDGFHDVETVMHAVTLCDNLTVSYVPSKDTRVILEVIGAPYIPTDDRNLAVKAAKLFLSYCGVNGVVKIVLQKNIPVCAGLGGGSSDAAAVLRALNKILKYPLSNKILLKLASQIGSDVPFCVTGKTAFATGRGENMTTIPFFGSFVFVIGTAKERMSTPLAYSNLDACFHDFDGSVPFVHHDHLQKLMAALTKNFPVPALFNIFEEAVFPVCQGAYAIKEIMLNKGAVSAALSGSGPAVFGIFTESETAQSCKKRLTELGYSAFVCYSAG